MITYELCRLILDAQDNPDFLAPSIRSFLKTVEAKHNEKLNKRDSARLTKWTKKLFQICVQIKSLPIELQLALETNLYFKLLGRFLTMFLDATLYFAKKVPNPEELINQAFKDMLLIQEQKGSMGYIWSAIANSSIMQPKFVKHLDIVIALAITRMKSNKTTLSNDQFIRMAFVLNSMVGEPEKFDARCKDAQRLKIQGGLEKYLSHAYSKPKWLSGLSADEVKDRLLSRNNRPPKEFLTMVADTIKKEDITNLHQINLFAEQLSTSSVKISDITAKLVNEPKKDKRKSRDTNEKSTDTVISSNAQKSVNGRENERAGSNKRPVSEESSKNKRSKKSDQSEPLMGKPRLPWEIAWGRLTHHPVIKLTRINLKDFEKVGKITYIVK